MFFLPSQRSVPARPALLLLILSLAPACWPASLAAQGVEYVKANYTKYEFRIPMRDGARLFTAVYVPKDRSQSYPILLSRTPYGVQPYGVDAYRADIGPSPLFGSEGYIVAYQDVRGRWMSEGEFVNMRPHKDVKSGPADIDESTDTFDTIDWLIKNISNHNGKVGMWGISYPGFYTAAGMIDAHPALKAASPQAPIADWFAGDDWHHNGALFLPHAFDFLAFFGHPRPEPTKKEPPERFHYGTPDGYTFYLQLGPLSNVNKKYFKDDVPFWNEMMQHANYDDFWTAQSSTAPQEHSTGRADGRRLVRRRESVRGARDLQERGGLQPRHHQRPGDGPLAPWRLGAGRRFLAWPGPFLHEHRRALS